MKKYIVILLAGLTFSSFATANLSATVQLGSTDYQLNYLSYDGSKGTDIDQSFLSRDLTLTYADSSSGIKFGVKFGGLASESESSEHPEFSRVNTVKRDEYSVFATKNVYGIPITIGYYSSTLDDKVRDSDGYQYDAELTNDGFFVSGSYIIPLADNYGAYAKLGYQTSSVEERYVALWEAQEVDETGTSDFDGSAGVYGVGVYYVLNSKSSIVVSYEKKNFSYDECDDCGVSLEEEMSNLSVGYSYNF